MMKKRKGKRSKGWLMALANLLCFALIAVAFLAFNTDYQEKLVEQNLRDIENLNSSAATITASFFENQQQRLDDYSQYIRRAGLSHREALRYLNYSNASLTNQYQLVGTDGAGYLAKANALGEYEAVAYDNYSYVDLQRIFAAASPENVGQVAMTPEFTDASTSYRSFAFYTTVRVKDDADTAQYYTLMSVCRSNTFVNMIHVDGGYTGIATVLMDDSGNYVISSADFKGVNLYQYLYTYNGLTLDQKNALAESVRGQDTGYFYYENSLQQECVFVYTRLTDTNLYTVTMVPRASFHATSFDYRFTVIMVLLLVVMFLIDMQWLRRLNKRLVTSIAHEKEANNAKTDFLSRMSHDIRTPLNGIIGMTILAMDEDNPPATQDGLKKIDASSHFLLGLVNDILDMSKVESGKMELHPEAYRYSQFLSYIEAVIAPLCKDRGVIFTANAIADDSPMELDRLRFNQIFFNLLSNAVKFTPNGGHVSISCVRTPNGPGRSNLDVTVRDDGIGMRPEFQAHLFEAFSQENRVPYGQAGSGLGLAIVKNLVGLMGGTIDFVSAEGKGTTFCVHMQTKTAAEVQQAVVQDALTPDSVLAGARVLLCEDHPLNAQIAQRLLEKKQVQVTLAENGQIGVDKFTDAKAGTFDAILMDIRMPVMDGLEATRTIRALARPDAKTIPIIAMTANAYDTDVENCKKAGMNAHLAKPIEPAKIYQTLAEEIRRQKGTKE